MSEILLLNARKKRAKTRRKPLRRRKTTRRRTTTTRRKTTRKPVARRATKGAAMPRKRTTTRRRGTKRRASPRRNPSRARRAGRAVARRTSSAIGGLNIRSALKNIPIQTAGMMAAKWAAKRFGGATETDPASWTWASYLKGAAGAAGAGILANMMRPGWGQKILEGGMTLMAYKLLQNELIPKSTWASGQFGAAGNRYPGVIEQNEEGEPFILGEDYQWYPLEGMTADEDRMLEGYGYGDELVKPGPLGYGDELVEPGPLGFGEGDEFLTR